MPIKADDALERMLGSKPSTTAELRELLMHYLRMQPSSPQWFQMTDVIVGTLLLREIKRAQEIEEKQNIVPATNGGEDAGPA
jgi:hypothetical protein